MPAGEPLAVLLRNRDAALHNLAIYPEGDGDAVFVGEFIGTGEILYRFRHSKRAATAFAAICTHP